MTSEIKQAFSHPELRSCATSGGAYPDRISVRGHIEDVEIGAFQAERDNTQRLQFDLVVEVADPSAPLNDDVDRILSYDTLTQAIVAALAAERLNLLETLAEHIAARILQEPQAIRVFVRIQKLDRGTGALGVEIVRGRDAATVKVTTENQPRPLIVFLQNIAVFGNHIDQWVERFTHYSGSVVLCVDLPDKDVPQTGDATSQRRIDLLKIEQTAWVLAGRQPRLVVVDSKTELVWGMKHDQLSLWAPSKIIMDAVDGPAGSVSGLKLAVWLAKELNAERMIVIGEPDARALHQTFDPAKPAKFK